MNIELLEDHGTLGIKKAKLVADLKEVVVDADDLLREVASLTSEELVAARARLETRMRQTIATFREARSHATQKFNCVADASCDYVRENPWKVFGVAAASLLTAVLLSRLSSR